MRSTTIRVEEDVYERLKAEKRENESFSDTVNRLLGGRSLLSLVGLWSADEIQDVRTVLDTVDTDAKTDIDEVTERVDVRIEE